MTFIVECLYISTYQSMSVLLVSYVDAFLFMLTAYVLRLNLH